MKNKYTFSLVLLISFSLLFSLPEPKAQTVTRTGDLLKFSADQNRLQQQRKAEAVAFARQYNLPERTVSADGTVTEIMYVENGIPFYYITENINAAASTSADDLWPGGILGLSLTGQGYTGLGEWDGGAVRATHQEFNNSGSSRVTQMDNAPTVSDHSTHVAGTLIAGGVSALAKGMANGATLKAWEWTSDVSEMAAAAANGLEISNHSYGYIRGWYYNNSSWVWYGNSSVSSSEDYLFGFYNSYSKSWDEVAYNAPYYLIVKSAGNDRMEGPTGGTYPKDGAPNGYDCIGEVGVAKNILTVGAVNDVPDYAGPSSVVMSSFSGWGPADDGRIKPDIVANGVGLYSCLGSGNTAYGSYSGTSMASPNAAGTMALMQQHYRNTHDASMRAATLKGLVIHTADEAGPNPGPDYMFGWGLMNANRAAQVITGDAAGTCTIDELVLNNGGSYSLEVQSDGTQSLTVTLCWTDPPGTPTAAMLDPSTPMLVHDLDLRVTGNSTTFYPWKLDRNNPANVATRSSENNVDNVEQVLIEAPVPGTYTILIDHDGTLAQAQAYSLIVSGAAAAPPQPPVADFTGTPTNLQEGQSVSFTDLSLNNPASWEWTFNGGTPATSSQQNPVVTYSTAGIYDVTLTVTNVSGSSTLTRTAYITVTEPAYCASHGNASAEYVKSVKIGTLTNASGSSGTAGYQDFTAFTFSAAKNVFTTLTITPGFTGSSQNEYWKIWIDYNRDGDFLDSGEQVFSASKKKTAVTGKFKVPSSALTGTTLMRVSMKRGALPDACETFAWGEVEDYTVNITSAPKSSLVNENQVAGDGDLPATLRAGDIMLYPNPVSGSLNISLLKGAETSSLTILTLEGRQVSKSSLSGLNGMLDTGSLAPGLYILAIENGGQTVFKKFVKR
jgi:PKD repeat protein